MKVDLRSRQGAVVAGQAREWFWEDVAGGRSDRFNISLTLVVRQ